MTHRSIIAIELEHCNLSQMAQIELCEQISSAIVSYMDALLNNGYQATLLFTISEVINCRNCAHCRDGICHVFKREAFANEFCHCWMKVKDMEGDDA